MAKRPAARTTAKQPAAGKTAARVEAARQPEARRTKGGTRPANHAAPGEPVAGTNGLARLLERLDALEARIARMEGETGVASAVAAQFDVSLPAPAAERAATAPTTADPGPTERPSPTERSPKRPEITEEVMLVLSAAVAAFFGERAHIKQVRLVHSDAWAQQGRVSVMASHRWAIQRG